MANIINYVLYAGGQSFSEKPFNHVDNLILSLLSYVRYDGLVPALKDNKPPVAFFDAVSGKADYEHLQDIFNIKSVMELVPLLLISRRFGRMMLNYYVSKTDEKTETQFSAVTFSLDDGSHFISFKGTDGTFVGWKEDFNMAFLMPVPAQTESVKYLNAVAPRLQGALCVGGHSKGGNLALYSSSMCDKTVQRRIKAIFDNDGPGFKEGFFDTEGFMNIENRLLKFVPKSSVVGMLLYHWSGYTVVDSDGFGVLQHDPFTWLVKEDGFITLQAVDSGALLMDRTLDGWLDSMTDKQRQTFVGTLFDILKSTQAKDFMGIASDWMKTATSLLGAIKDIDPEVRKVLFHTIGSLMSMTAREFTGEKKTKFTQKFLHSKDTAQNELPQPEKNNLPLLEDQNKGAKTGNEN